jgi:general stress protein YciG
MEPTPTKKPRGFAAMSPEKRREIARLGGAAVPADRRSFSIDRSLAVRAGSIGGSLARGGRGVSQD